MKVARSITAIIIDDDNFSSTQLKELVEINTNEVEIKAICNSAEEGIVKIQELSPDLVFLDIEMPGMNGFEMIKKLPTVNFEIIFTTAFDHYAIRAIKFSALDYLTKPVEAEALKDALSRLARKKEKKGYPPQQPETVIRDAAEKEKTDALLRKILPADIAEDLKETGGSEARLYDNVSVLFTDFVNFTKVAEGLSPLSLVKELHTCFTAFDGIIDRNGLEKIKTAGDAYLAVCGLPLADERHAYKTVIAALEIRDYIEDRSLKENVFKIRIGISSGPVAAGIVGVKKYAYDIWGDTVNIAARMEQHSEPGKVNISATTQELVKGEFTEYFRGQIDAKNKGALSMYFIEKK